MNNLMLQGVGMTSLRTRERLIQRLRDQGITSELVLRTLLNTPRHVFLDEALSHRAYEDTALPIGFGQTLSQPYTVARMTQLLIETTPARAKVLEIGTGSGYQTTVLAQLFKKVYSVERISGLFSKAHSRLSMLGLDNVSLKHSDGTEGWACAGPFDGIISTAAPNDVPEKLLNQLNENGVLVIPVGDHDQYLHVIQRVGGTSRFETRLEDRVRFVPFVAGVVG